LLPHFGRASDATISSNFVRTGQTESLTAPLTLFGGATTTQIWSGLIEVLISGVGRNNVVTTDAFYFFDPNNPSSYSPGLVGLRLSFTGCAAADCGQPPWLLSFIRFVDGVGPVPPPSVNDPTGVVPYSLTHQYRVV